MESLSKKRQFIENSSEEWYSGYDVKSAVEKLKEEMNEKTLYNISRNNLIVIKEKIDKIFGEFK